MLRGIPVDGVKHEVEVGEFHGTRPTSAGRLAGELFALELDRYRQGFVEVPHRLGLAHREGRAAIRLARRRAIACVEAAAECPVDELFSAERRPDGPHP